jgi:signal transduction histidine kinase
VSCLTPRTAGAGLIEGKKPEDRPDAGDILVVDDNPRNLIAIEAALAGLDQRMIKASSGREALRHLLKGDPAVVLLDVQMPSMDGYETARLIRSRQRTRHLPIIFITAYDRDDQEVLAAYKLGAVDFLFKPIVPEILQAKVSVFVALRQRAIEVARQSALLRDHERREHARRFEEERRRWEAAVLRERMEEERRSAEAMSRKATELAEIIAAKERIERELVRTNTRLAEADRRKDEFLAVLAHELRNPLSALVAGLEVLNLDPVSPDSASRARDAIRRQTDQLARLVDDLLDVSRISSGKVELRSEALDLATVVRDAIEAEKSWLDRSGRRIAVDLPADRPLPIRGDPARLTQIVSNLLHNAVRHTRSSGNIRIACAQVNGDAQLTVGDDGCGIRPEVLSRIFDLFYQQSPGHGGLGLGLTLVHQLISLHDGTVSAHSAGEGQGSTFTVSLPLRETTGATAPENKPPPRPKNKKNSLRIVIIEDNEDSRLLLCDLLEHRGHTVLAAGDGAAGLELLLSADADAALVDIHLPQLDGYGVAAGVRAKLSERRPRLVAMTGFGQQSDRDRALEAGFDAHLVKPAGVDAILEALFGD